MLSMSEETSPLTSISSLIDEYDEAIGRATEDATEAFFHAVIIGGAAILAAAAAMWLFGWVAAPAVMPTGAAIIWAFRRLAFAEARIDHLMVAQEKLTETLFELEQANAAEPEY